MGTTGTKRTRTCDCFYVFTGPSGTPLVYLIRLLANLHRALRCFFHGVVNIFEGFMEAAGRNPAAFNKFNNDFLGSSQYLFVDGRHVTAPLTRISLSISPIRLPSLLLG